MSQALPRQPAVAPADAFGAYCTTPRLFHLRCRRLPWRPAAALRCPCLWNVSSHDRPRTAVPVGAANRASRGGSCSQPALSRRTAVVLLRATVATPLCSCIHRLYHRFSCCRVVDVRCACRATPLCHPWPHRATVECDIMSGHCCAVSGTSVTKMSCRCFVCVPLAVLDIGAVIPWRPSDRGPGRNAATQ